MCSNVRARKLDLLDHLVGAQKQGCGKLHAHRLQSLKIEDKFKPRWQQYRKIGWEITLEDPAGIYANLPVRLREAGPVAHQAASYNEFSPRIDHRYRKAPR